MTDETQTTTETQTPANSGDQTQTQTSGTEGTTAAAASGKGGKGATTQTETKAEPLFWEGFADEKLKASPVILRHKTVEDLARSLDHAEKRLGVPADQLIRKPTRPEEMPDVYRALGAPETPEGYQIAVPENASDEDKAAVKSFAEHMHKTGPFPPDFVKAAVEWNNQQAEAATAALEAEQAARRSEGEALLKKELGAAFDPEMKAVGKLLNDLGGEDLQKELDASGMGDNPRLMLLLHKMVERLGEPGALDGQGNGVGGGRTHTPASAKAALAALNADPIKGIALRDRNHSMHKSVVKERDDLAILAEGRQPSNA